MCLIAFNFNPLIEIPLTVIANRDEFYNRPSAQANWWDKPNNNILGGRDLQNGGSWLGVNTRGYFAALTNFRDPSRNINNAPSRGLLVSNFLSKINKLNAEEYLNEVYKVSEKYNDFNLIIYDGKKLMAYSSRKKNIENINPGVHAISNAHLNTPWVKVEKIKLSFLRTLKQIENPVNEQGINQLFRILTDGTLAEDNQLPQTGISFEKEKALSAINIKIDGYGTRAATVVQLSKYDVVFQERLWEKVADVGESYQLSNSPLFNFNIIN